ncbi:hypothetical protein SBI_07740 [Streptomyces bingchenggensis BCW-1]|uniref:Secreted protein n=1 Tax=Streptomyces bingchenggensis (strain BCW-1) TaxID=749414 RepID=D7CD13_STRBB|nr:MULTISPECIES: hypothetical protein [Streptomyces]ADI10860.1 hypothetical protein SBI_07740 [Streptomyces bingchenggensis BCW-1]
MLRSRRGVRSAIVASAAILVAASATAAFAAPSLPSSAQPGTSPRASGWSESRVTPGDASLLASTRPDASTTWAAGMRFVLQGEATRFVPTLWERDERKGPGWNLVQTAPLPQSYDIRFNDVDASSPSNAIVGGDYAEQAGGVVTQRWNGRDWKSVIAPVPRGSLSAGFLSVDTRAPDDAWGAGWAEVPVTDDNFRHVGLLEHWDGTRWEEQKLPDVGAGESGGWTLNGVTALAADDVWAVGSTYGAEPLLLHYGGTRWSKAPAPDTGARGGLNAVASGPDGQVWAVGDVRNPDGSLAGLALKYDGGKWVDVPLPEGTGELSSVTLSQGSAVVMARATDDTPSVVLRRSGDSWVSMNLPVDAADPLNATDVSASGRTIDVTGLYPPSGSQAAGPGAVLTARR